MPASKPIKLTVRRRAATLCLYLVPDSHRGVMSTRAVLCRMGDMAPKAGQLVATHEIDSGKIVTEQGCPFEDEDLLRLFTRWYSDLAALVPATWKVDLRRTGDSFQHMKQRRVKLPFQITALG